MNCRIGSLEIDLVHDTGKQCVNCRIGSLEKLFAAGNAIASVNCRIGSLEIDRLNTSRKTNVNCRIGSLEKKLRALIRHRAVNCRIGSLCVEMCTGLNFILAPCVSCGRAGRWICDSGMRELYCLFCACLRYGR